MVGTCNWNVSNKDGWKQISKVKTKKINPKVEEKWGGPI
jgi:hypothetical protein